MIGKNTRLVTGNDISITAGFRKPSIIGLIINIKTIVSDAQPIVGLIEYQHGLFSRTRFTLKRVPNGKNVFRRKFPGRWRNSNARPYR